MGEVLWSVVADFDRDGEYEYSLTADIEKPGNGITIDRGFNEDGLYKVSRVTIVVSNRAGTYSPGNAESALAGLLRPGVPVVIQAVHNTILYTAWTGYIQEFAVSGVEAGGVPVCTLTCFDLAGYLQQYNPLNVLLAARNTKDAYEAIAADAGLNAADYHFSHGRQDLAYHWVRNKDALSAFADVLQAEMGGWWWVDALGVIQGQSRGDRLGVTPSQTWGDGTTVYPRRAAVKTSDRHIISRMLVQGRSFVQPGDTEVLFTFSRNADNPVPDSILIPAGGTYGPVLLDFAGPVESIVTPEATTDYTANDAIDGSGTDRTASLGVAVDLQGAGFELTLTNSHSGGIYVTAFQLRGLQASNEPGPAFTYEMTIPGDKTGRGEQAQIPFVDDIAILADFAVQCVRTNRYEFPVLTLDFDASNDAKKLALLSLELGELVRYTDTGLGASGTYTDEWAYVDGIKLVIPPDLAGQTFQATVTLVPTYLYRDLDRIAWDTFNRDDASGSLGNSTSGAAWTGTGFDIDGNAAAPNGTGEETATIALGARNVVAEVVVNNVEEGAAAGLTYRYQDADNHLRAYIDPLTNQLILEKVVAGVATEIAAEALV